MSHLEHRQTALTRVATLIGIVLSTALSAPTTASAVTPTTISLMGAVLNGKTPVVDGKYGFKVSLYADATGAAIWSETFLGVLVSSGAFSLVLGKSKPIGAKVLAAAKNAHIGIQVDADPELTRVPLTAVAYSMHAAGAGGLTCSGCVTAAHLANATIKPVHVGFSYAASALKGGPATTALDLQCTGCVKNAALALDGDLNLGKFGLKAGKVTASSVIASVVAAQSFTGDGSKLTGIKTPAGKCTQKGQVVTGIAADGSLICAAALDLNSLPADGLSAVSNGLLSNQFTDIVAINKTVVIPDNNPGGASAVVDVPDLGTAQTLTVRAHVTTSSIGQLAVTVIDPTGAKFVLHSQTGTAKELKGKWPPNKTVSGDLLSWKGKNPKGKWTLVAVDNKFLSNKTDGAIADFAVEIGTLSNKKVVAKGALLADGGFRFTSAKSPPTTCNAANFGFAYANPADKSLYICNGTDWYPLVLAPVGTKDTPGKSCLDIHKKMPAAKTGKFWVASAGVKREVYCDMDSHDGGWTLVATMRKNSYCHIDIKAAGTLADPKQGACAKLSDAEIRALYSDQFWLSCGTIEPWRFGKIDKIANFNASANTGNKKMSWSTSYKGKTYGGTDNTCCNFGDHSYHDPHIIYSIATGYNNGNYKKGDWTGCYNSKHGWHQNGYLYVR